MVVQTQRDAGLGLGTPIGQNGNNGVENNQCVKGDLGDNALLWYLLR